MEAEQAALGTQIETESKGRKLMKQMTQDLWENQLEANARNPHGHLHQCLMSVMQTTPV